MVLKRLNFLSETPGSARVSAHDYSLPLDLKCESFQLFKLHTFFHLFMKQEENLSSPRPEDLQHYRRRVSLPRNLPAGGRDLFNSMSEEVNIVFDVNLHSACIDKKTLGGSLGFSVASQKHTGQMRKR